MCRYLDENFARSNQVLKQAFDNSPEAHSRFLKLVAVAFLFLGVNVYIYLDRQNNPRVRHGYSGDPLIDALHHTGEPGEGGLDGGGGVVPGVIMSPDPSQIISQNSNDDQEFVM